MIEQQTNEPIGIICSNCNTENLIQSKFCKSCGSALKARFKNQANNDTILYSVIAFFIITVLLITLYGFTELIPHTFENSLIVDAIFAAIILAFAISNYKQLIMLYRLSSINVLKTLLLSLLMIVLAFGVNSLATTLNEVFFDNTNSTTSIYQESTYPLLLSILMIGLYPAFFEELAFRGFLFNNLLLFSSPRSVIAVTGILFAFIHFSFLGLIWYIPLGLFFGYLRFRYRTIWYSMICHFVYNTTIVAIEFI